MSSTVKVRKSSITRSQRVAIASAEFVVAKPTTAPPARRPASNPVNESSNTTQRSGATPRRSANRTPNHICPSR